MYFGTGILLDANRIGNKLKYDTCESSNRVIKEKKIARFEEKMATIDWNFYTTSMGRIQNLMLFKLNMKKSIMSVFRLPKRKNQTIEKTLNRGY